MKKTNKIILTILILTNILIAQEAIEIYDASPITQKNVNTIDKQNNPTQTQDNEIHEPQTIQQDAIQTTSHIIPQSQLEPNQDQSQIILSQEELEQWKNISKNHFAFRKVSTTLAFVSLGMSLITTSISINSNFGSGIAAFTTLTTSSICSLFSIVSAFKSIEMINITNEKSDKINRAHSAASAITSSIFSLAGSILLYLGGSLYFNSFSDKRTSYNSDFENAFGRVFIFFGGALTAVSSLFALLSSKKSKRNGQKANKVMDNALVKTSQISKLNAIISSIDIEPTLIPISKTKLKPGIALSFKF